jgi:GDP/UDP-N,N'-diacetylbacillosamine 2-epimerase (hydrolysing)
MKICVVTGTRAEYGLLRWVMQGIRATPQLQLQVVATGMHLSPEFGLTYREIEKDGFAIDRKVEILLSADTGSSLAKSMGVGMIGFADTFRDLAPDLLLVLGDRFEIFAAVATAMVARIPVAHLGGGETTEGAFDESIRHCLTKMSHLHFVGMPEYRKRVIQLGEQPDRVFVVGGLGVDAIKKVDLIDRAALEQDLGFRFGTRNLLVTFHPATLEHAPPAAQMEELLAALREFEDVHLIFTMPNADTDSRALFALIEKFVANRANARAYTSLGQQRYFSCVAQVDGVVGNSSSGLAEVPSFNKATVNIGDRQLGRMKAQSVIDCAPVKDDIVAAVERLFSPEFRAKLPCARNPYGDGGASEKILDILRRHPLEGILRKSFHDLPAAAGE